MKAQQLAAALREYKAIAAGSSAADRMTFAYIYDGGMRARISLETALLLAAENLERGAKYDALVGRLSAAGLDEIVVDGLVDWKAGRT